MSAPTPEQPKKDLDFRAIVTRMWPFAAPSKELFLAALILTPVATAISLAQPWLMKAAIEEHIEGVGAGAATDMGLDTLGKVAAAYLGAVVLGYVVRSAYSIIISIAGQRTVLRLRSHVVEHLLSRSPSFFDKRPAGALLTRATSDIEALGESLSSGVVTILLDVLTIIGVLIAMFLLEWRMTLLLLTVGPPLALIIELCRRALRQTYNTIRSSLSAVNAYLNEQVNGMEVVQLFNHQGGSHRGFVERNTVYKDATIRSNIFDALMYAAVDGIGSICIALMLWYATGRAEAGITAGLMVAFIDYLNRLFRPLREFSGKIAIIQRAGAALQKVTGLLDTDESIASGPKVLDQVKGEVVFEDVRFGYRPEPEYEVLKGVSLTVSPGEVVAIVGSTGCGKTTLTRLLSRCYEGYTGRITLDGVELRELSLSTVRQAVARVRQDIQLFPDTVKFNVDLGNPKLDMAQLESAAELVNADRVIASLPQGWQHQLTERGANVSVGQGQLLSFARTMAYDAPVVILDEATASVDPVTEQLIQTAIERILERKTVLVIAHRLSTITAADRIIVMDAGRVIESGTHQELLAAGGHYAGLYQAGFDGEESSDKEPAPQPS